MRLVIRFSAGLGLLAACGPSESSPPMADTPDVGFFVTSRGSEDGGNLGGLAGADARCAELADAAGLPPRQWRAFLSVSGPVHARDRIGAGPWHNVAGVLVAEDVEQLLAEGIASESMLDEFGDPAAKSAPPGREHDIVTGTDEDGQLVPGRTCADWTSNLASERAAVGHHDWTLLPNDDWVQSWTNVHRASCDAEGMARQLGTARTYCFAVD